MEGNGSPVGYERKFGEFIRLCANPDADIVTIHHPAVLGDDYAEIVESLNRLSDAKKMLLIVPRNERAKTSPA